MPRYVERVWSRSRRGGAYRAYVADEIAGLEPRLATTCLSTLVAAERGIERLQLRAEETGLEALGSLLLRSEGLASSRVEGLDMSQKRLVQVIFQPDSGDYLARSVLGNIRSMEAAVALGASVERVTTEGVVSMHDTLLRSTPDGRRWGGQLRTEQGWIGGNSPLSASFVPAPEHEIQRLLEDLCRFVNRTDLPAVLQAAIAHAQFELIHPFADGNGRIGRCLIHVILRRRGGVTRVVPPVSTVFAADKDHYVNGIGEFAKGNLEPWCAQFADTTRIACERAIELTQQLAAAREQWYEKAGRPRRGSTVLRLLDLLLGQPVVDVPAVATELRVSGEAARLAVVQLEGAGVLRQVALSKVRRAWMATDVPDLLDAFERETELAARAELGP